VAGPDAGSSVPSP